MMRSLSSCLDVTRMWRRTDRASLEKVLGSEREFEAARGLIGGPGFGFLGDVRRVIVEDQLDRGVGRIGGVEKLEEFDEFAAAMAIPDQGMDLAGKQVDAGQKADCAVALIFM